MFTCISLELQVRTGSNLETRYRYHPRSQSYQKKKISMQVRPAIMGCNGSVVLGAYVQIVFWHIFFTHGLQFITHLQFGPDFTVQPSPVLWCKVSPHKCLGFSLFSDVQKCLEHIYPIILESWSQIWILMPCSNDPTYLVLKSKLKLHVPPILRAL